MNKSNLITFLFLLAALTCYSQKLEVKKKLKVAVNDAANPKYRVKVLDPAADIYYKAENINYDTSGHILFYQRTKKSDWSLAKDFHYDSITLPPLLDSSKILYADIKPDEGRLLVHFWPFTSNDIITNDPADQFLKNHEFAIMLEDRTNLSFTSSSIQFGALSLPIKVYLGAPDSVSAVQSAASVGLYAGRKWSKTKFVKLPSEKEFSTYQSAYSLNATAGLNALELKTENTSDKGAKFKGTITTLSLGIAVGWHYKTFTVFLASGFDIPLSNKGSNWSLKGKPWIGFGAGFEIF